MLFDSVISSVGRTPLVHFRRLFDDTSFEVYGKLESANPGGSMKDRPALRMIETALEDGRIDGDTVVVESSSGNMGIGLAQVCGYHGIEFRCVVDPRTTDQNLRLLRAYGARLEVVEAPDPETGEYLPARLKRVQHILSTYENSFWPNQYANLENPAAHCDTTMSEIAEALDHHVDYLFCSMSTCGTARGCADYIRQSGMSTYIYGVDAVGSIISSNEKTERYIPGMGAGSLPDLHHDDIVDDYVRVTDADCVAGCRRLVDREAILAGGSSGGIMTAIRKIESRIAPGSTCVAIICDRGERYARTVYDDAWVSETLGEDVLLRIEQEMAIP